MPRLLFLIGMTLLVIGCTSQQASGPGNATIHDESALMTSFEISNTTVSQRDTSVRLIDVREESELVDTGVIEGAINIPLGSLSLNTMQEHNIAKNDEVIVYCRSGARSRQAYDVLTALGYTNVKSMYGGIVHWEEDGYPLVPWIGNVSASVSSVTTTGPQIVFDRFTEDFGLVAPDVVQTTHFTVRNEGADELIIESLSTSCGCTSAEIEDMSIAPGAEAILTVRFDPNVHEEPEGRFQRTVFVASNDPINPEVELTISLDIDE